MQKVLIGMSGGVDSCVAAYLILRSGYDAAGATMSLCTGLPGVPPTDTSDAQRAAAQLGIPFSVLDAADAFRSKVVDPFASDYEKGLTPNPCIYCNCHIKFDAMLQYALDTGCDHIATGHYAQIVKDPQSGRYLLKKAKDPQKDQSYFLASLNQFQLSHTLLPLGGLTKEQVRQIAQEQHFEAAHKKDSQDICFIPGGDYVQFLMQYTNKSYPEGDFLNADGVCVGKHKGAIRYTIGQRKGLGLAMGEPVYVCAKNMTQNTVTVGTDEELFHTALIAENWNWIAFDSLKEPMKLDAKIRYRHTPQPATVYPNADGSATVIFDAPQRAITPGQAVVLYDGDTVIGSGTIMLCGEKVLQRKRTG